MSRKSSKNSSVNDVQEKCSAEIRDFQAAIAENKKCFECDQRGPTYVDMTIGSFVCTKCSGMLRGITPPHRIKSISMSSFTMEEVQFLKSRGNVWCSKVWMGLYDKNRSLDAKDDESLKNHIIQKYEKKSYYVDPSTIQQSLTAASSISQSIASTSASNSFGTSGGFIGTTLNQRNSSHVARPSPSTSSNTSPIVKSTSTPKPNGSVRTGLSGVVLPPPVSDPFVSAFGPPPVSNTSVPAPPSLVTSSSNNSTSSTVMESFANFDNVKFESVSDPWSSPQVPAKPADANQKSSFPPPSSAPFNTGVGIMTPKNSSMPSGASKPTLENTKLSEAEDKYAALKDLDEIFKSTVVMSDGKSTGTSLFGSSPYSPPAASSTCTPSQPSQQSVFGPSPTNGTSVGDQFAANWGNSTQETSRTDRGPSPNAGWASNWPTTNSSETKAPINPFTGASNLTQLNTSPWPTTGTSPVQNQSTNNWSNFGTPHLSSSTMKMGSSSNASNAGVSPIDPFGAAPAANLQNSENNNDLFAKAPFDSKIEDNTINALTSEIFGKATTTFNGNLAPKGVALNPWATPPSNNTSTLFHPSKPNPTNPFL